jgi:hypothetical protein
MLIPINETTILGAQNTGQNQPVPNNKNFGDKLINNITKSFRDEIVEGGSMVSLLDENNTSAITSGSYLPLSMVV